MKARLSVCVFLLGILSLVATSFAHAADAPKQPVTIKIEGAKMPPVTFSHGAHQKVACAVCHHKDAQNPKACTTCHTVKGGQGGAPAAKDAFHTRCIGCHKEAGAKGAKAPTKCNDCHKK
jgi:hypothetical protein